MLPEILSGSNGSSPTQLTNVNGSDQKNAKSYFIGATISPYKSYRLYWQSELSFNYFESSFSSQSGFRQVQFNPPVLSNGTIYDTGFTQTSSNTKTTRNLADVVPISLRYNINNYIGVGVGPQFSVLLSQKVDAALTKKYYEPIFDATAPPRPGNEITSLREDSFESSKTNAFEKMQTSVFADATFGFARIGPSLGIRYYLNFEKDFNYWQFYAIWKF